jgi:hypothetical protein
VKPTRLDIARFAIAKFLRKPSVRGLFDAVATTAVGLVGGYDALDPRRKILPNWLWLRSISQNELATMSLPQLRALCRKLERDNPTARAGGRGPRRVRSSAPASRSSRTTATSR